MLKVIKSSIRDTAIYSIGTFASKLTGFILVPLYTNREYLSEFDYGVLNLVEANMLVLASVFGLGLSYAYERWYWDKEQIHRRNSIFFTILISTVVGAFILCASLFPFSGILSEWLFQSSTYADVFQLMVINAGLEIIAQTPNSLIRLNEKPGLFTKASLLKLAVSLTGTVLFLVLGGYGLKSVYYGQLIGIACYFLFLSKFILERVQPVFEWEALKDMVRFRFPFILPVIAYNVLNFSDRFIISRLTGMSEAGVYSLGARLAGTIKVFVITAIWLAITPTIYKMMDDPKHGRFYSKLMTYLGFTVMFFVLGMSFFSKEIVLLFATSSVYWDAYKVIPIISLGIYFTLLKDVSMIGMNITKKTGPVAITTISVSLVNVGLNFLFISFLGIMGSALAHMISQFIFFVIIYRIAQRQYPIPYELGKVIMMIMLFVVLTSVALLSNELSLWLPVPLKAGLLLLFPIILYGLKFFEAVELERLGGFWKKWRNPKRWPENLKTLEF